MLDQLLVDRFAAGPSAPGNLAARHWNIHRERSGRRPRLDPGEDTEYACAEFIIYLVGVRGILPSTASNYLSQVMPYLQYLCGGFIHTSRGGLCARVLSTLRTWYPSGARTKLPVNAEMVRWLYGRTSYSLGSRTACAIMLNFALRRSGGVTVRGHTRMRVGHLQVVLLADGSTALKATIFGKTDDPHKGSVRIAGHVSDVLNAAEAWTTYQLGRPLCESMNPDSPAFTHTPGRPVTGDDISKMLKDAAYAFGLNPADYASHSIRIATATALANAGFEDSFIEEFGRWHSDTYKKYIRLSPHRLAAAATAIAASSMADAPVRR